MVFAREIQGRELTFGVSGKLIMNAVVMYDRQTSSLWSQFLAEAVDGPMAGAQMELIPAQLTSWEAWTTEHPDTLLLDRGGLRRTDSYSFYYRNRDAGILGESNKDRRLPVKELVVGLDHGQERIAYAFRDLSKEIVVNDTYEADPIVVTFDPESEGSAVFDRRVNGRTLTFESDDGVRMRDRETGTAWSASQGLALDGELAGAQLEALPSFVSFWFAWSDFYPSTQVYQPVSP